MKKHSWIDDVIKQQQQRKEMKLYICNVFLYIYRSKFTY